MRFGLLGTFTVHDEEISLGRHQRAVLALLLLEPGRVVTTAWIADALWGMDAPVAARNTVQQYVSTLRPHVIVERRKQGYVAQIEEQDVDLYVFRSRVASARALAAPAEIAAGLRGALELWRGEPLADVTVPGMDEVRAERELADLA